MPDPDPYEDVELDPSDYEASDETAEIDFDVEARREFESMEGEADYYQNNEGHPGD